MSFSFARMILEDVEKAVYDRGFSLANQKSVKLTQILNNACQSDVRGTQNYHVKLGFKRTGSPKCECTCLYFTQHSDIICKHIVATALVWDRSRSISDPEKDLVERLAIPEPEFSAKDLNAAFRDPVNANLDILRADPTGWMRPHAHLPNRPKVCSEEKASLQGVKQGISELRAWTRKSNFDPYFCAGEMIAGYCEMIRWLQDRIDDFTEDEIDKALELLINYHLELVQRIDDSDGLHIFNEAHLYQLLKEVDEKEPIKSSSVEQLKEKITDY